MQPPPVTPVSSASGAMPVKRCQNCNLELRGPYCHRCGQQDGVRLKSIGTFLHDVVSDVFNFDGKLFKTAIPLFFKPGALTRLHFEGKRAPYVPPLRLYLISSVLFFLAFSGAIDSILNEVPRKTFKQISEEGIAKAKTMRSEKEKRRNKNKPTVNDAVQQATPKKLNGEQFNTNIDSALAAVDTEQVARGPRVNIGFKEGDEYLERKLKDMNVYDLIRNFFNRLPTTLVLLMPIWALVMLMFYPFSKRYYMEHLVFNHHLHAFVFLYYSLLLVLYRLVVWATGSPPHPAIVSSALSLIPIVYIMLAYRNYYRQSWGLTLLKQVFILPVYVIVVSLVATAAIVFEIWRG